MFLMFYNFSQKQFTIFAFIYSVILSIYLYFNENTSHKTYAQILECPSVIYSPSVDTSQANQTIVNCASLFNSRVDDVEKYLWCSNDKLQREEYKDCNFSKHTFYNSSITQEERHFPLAFR